MIYKEIIKVRGWEMTPDKKYVLVPHEKGYHYWHTVLPGEEKAEGYYMGDYSHDYCFRDNIERSLSVLNRVLDRI